MEDTLSFISLYSRFGNHHRSFIKTLQAFAFNAQAVFNAADDELLATGLKPALLKQVRSASNELAEHCLDWLEQPDHHLIRFDSASYPALLGETADFPPLLFASGNPELMHQPQIAIVGSRRCTASGRQHARQFASTLSQYGFVITSGMAQGIDAAAHQGALDHDGHTIAVLGTGPDRIYPASHHDLARKIAERGLLLSEFPPGTGPAKHHFPRRNRIISGLSLATLVVEASLRSGSLITARLASEQGRDVFALPGSIHNPQVKGCHRLIREGAILVETPEQLAEDLSPMLGYLNSISPAPDTTNTPLDEVEQSLLQHIDYDPVSVDQLCERSGLTIDKLSSILLALELKQIIEPAPGGRIVRI